MFWNLVFVGISTGSLSETLGPGLFGFQNTRYGHLDLGKFLVVEPSIILQVTFM